MLETLIKSNFTIVLFILLLLFFKYPSQRKLYIPPEHYLQIVQGKFEYTSVCVRVRVRVCVCVVDTI